MNTHTGCLSNNVRRRTGTGGSFGSTGGLEATFRPEILFLFNLHKTEFQRCFSSEYLDNYF